MVLGISKSEKYRVSVDVKDPELPILTVLLELSACFSSYWSIFFSLGFGLPILACMTHQDAYKVAAWGRTSPHI